MRHTVTADCSPHRHLASGKLAIAWFCGSGCVYVFRYTTKNQSRVVYMRNQCFRIHYQMLVLCFRAGVSRACHPMGPGDRRGQSCVPKRSFAGYRRSGCDRMESSSSVLRLSCCGCEVWEYPQSVSESGTCISKENVTVNSKQITNVFSQRFF